MAKERSETVNAAIRRSYAILARAHFKRAEASIGALEETLGLESDRRMSIVERYLDKAGAQATKNNF